MGEVKWGDYRVSGVRDYAWFRALLFVEARRVFAALVNDADARVAALHDLVARNGGLKVDSRPLYACERWIRESANVEEELAWLSVGADFGLALGLESLRRWSWLQWGIGRGSKRYVFHHLPVLRGFRRDSDFETSPIMTGLMVAQSALAGSDGSGEAQGIGVVDRWFGSLAALA